MLGRTQTLSVDIDAQDKQEEALQRQIQEFNVLIRDKEAYVKSLLNELQTLKDQKDQFVSEAQVLGHKEEFLVSELIFKEDQLNEIIMTNEDLRRKINSGSSQTKFIQAENERLRREMTALKEESAL